jgi:glycosyltransferase involved in cell wall biosynthesis
VNSIQPKTVALVDFHWAGHHPTNFNAFILALEELGINVLAVCPGPEEAKRTADETRRDSEVDIPCRGRTEFKKITIPHKRFARIRPARISAIDWTIRHFRGIEKQVREWTKESGSKVDAIFYACIYDFDFDWFHCAQPFLQLPWSGLYLHALSFRMPGQPNPVTGLLPRPEKIFRGALCRGVAILDEGISTQVATVTGKPVVVLPEPVDTRRTTKPEDRILSERLRRFADGRPIVGLFGHLKKSKGVETFVEAARRPAAAEICFALAGDLVWNFDGGARSDLEVALSESPNLWTHLARIPREPCLNALMESCDVIFAAYADFPHSSGIQAKAAALQKPLIVSEGYLMAERVRRFNMGEVVPQGDVEALIHAIVKVTTDPIAWHNENQPRWSDYLAENSFERLKTSFTKLIAFPSEHE